MNIFKELATFNRITFVEDSHTYLIDGQPTNSPSVTQLLKRFKKKFDTEKMSAKVAKRTGETPQQVQAEWKKNNLYATTIGSMLHKYIENFYCNKKVQFEGSLSELGAEEKKKIGVNLPLLISHFQNFHRDNKHLVCARSEIVLGDIHDTKVCGMSDLLAYNTDTDMLEILDFKTNKKMVKHSPYGNLLTPFEDMSEGQINEYTIQLNTYKYFVEQNTNLKIGGLKIVWFNPNNENYQLFELEDIQPKIKKMFDVFKQGVSLPDAETQTQHKQEQVLATT